MKIPLMVTADYASVERETGKLNIIGVFNRILAKEFPASHRRMYFAVKFEGDFPVSSNENMLSIVLADEDGNEMLTIGGQFTMPETPPGIPPQCDIVFEFNQLEFNHPGDYLLRVVVNDGELDESVVLQVVQLEA